MFGFSHLPFCTSISPLYNGQTELFVLYVDQSVDIGFLIARELDISRKLENF